jgi:hypothetical protein
MRNRVPFLLLTCFGLSVALLNAQNKVAKGATPEAEVKAASLQKYVELSSTKAIDLGESRVTDL